MYLIANCLIEYQKSMELLIWKLPFQRLVREIAQEIAPDIILIIMSKM